MRGKTCCDFLPEFEVQNRKQAKMKRISVNGKTYMKGRKIKRKKEGKGRKKEYQQEIS